jgi:glycosyltransferase involved in cell wall biosynthesis
MKKVSIVIPYYNRARFLPHTLESVAGQTYRPLEVILVDNGSTDGSTGAAEEFRCQYAAPDFEVRLIREGKRGAACARNGGLAAATGEYCYFFDSDDEMSADFVRLAVTEMERGGNDMVGCFTLMVRPDGSTTARRYVRYPTVTDQILTAQLATQSIFGRTAFFRQAGGWNERLGLWDDWELGIRLLLQRPRMGWIEDGVFHRVLLHGESMTGDALSHDVEGIAKALKEVRALLEKQPLRQRRALAALCLRSAITGGQIAREGTAEQGRSVARCGCADEASALVRTMARWLYRYCERGGRAAWLIALTALKMVPEH